MKTLLITGTDTDVGKTVLTTCLAAYCQQYRSQQSLGLMKLLQTGTLGDRTLYQQLFQNNKNIDIVTPLCLDTPVAPPIAAELEGVEINLGQIWQALGKLQAEKDLLLVEALGGLGSPVTRELTVADIAGDWRLETVLVVPVQLGAIGQAVANVSLASQKGVKLKGIILSCRHPEAHLGLNQWTPQDLIESLTNVPILGILPYLEDVMDLTALSRVASDLDLEMLI